MGDDTYKSNIDKLTFMASFMYFSFHDLDQNQYMVVI